MKQYDVVVIGGGLVGATLACLLAHGQRPLSIAVVDAREPRPYTTDEWDLRVSAVSLGSRNVLQAAGAWPGIETRRISPYQEMTVWDATCPVDGPETLHFDCAELGETRLGYIIENGLMQTALLERLKQAQGVEWICPEQLEGVDSQGDRCVVALRDRGVVATRLLVGADGAASQTRSLAGIDVSRHDYHQRAVVTHVATRDPHRETAWQRFLATGPLAFLPLCDGRCSIVWSTSEEEAERLVALPEQEFCAAVTEASDGVLGPVIDVGPRASFPLRALHARRYTGERLALLGDAAHTVHPLAGQGVNLGYLDAAALAEVIFESCANDGDPGDRRGLRRFERWRKSENAAMVAAIDGLQRLFTAPAAPVRWLRAAGLGLVNQSRPLKNLFMERAMGLAGELPARARQDIDQAR